MGSGIVVGTCVECPLAGASLHRAFLTTENSVVIERDHLLEKLNRHKLDNERLKKLILVMNAAMKDMSTYLENIEKKVAVIETDRGLLANSNAEQFFFCNTKSG